MFKVSAFWFGVVKDRNDPLQLGRCRVRISGVTVGEDKDLPWAHVMVPITSATMSGVGMAPVGIVEGTTVFGFFREEKTSQEPIILGSLPGINMEFPETYTELMKDTRDEDAMGVAPRRLLSVSLQTNGHGARIIEQNAEGLGDRLPLADGKEIPYPRPEFINRPDTPIGVDAFSIKFTPATDKEAAKLEKEPASTVNSSLSLKTENLDKDVPVAEFTGLVDIKVNIPADKTCEGFEKTPTPTPEPGEDAVPDIVGARNAGAARGTDAGIATFDIIINGTSYSFSLDYNNQTFDNVINNLNNKLKNENISQSDATFKKDGDRIVLKTSVEGTKLRVDNANPDTTRILGLENGQKNQKATGGVDFDKGIISGGGSVEQEDLPCEIEDSEAEVLQLDTSLAARNAALAAAVEAARQKAKAAGKKFGPDEEAEVTVEPEYADKWSEPSTQAKPIYPYNKIYTSESGHTIEIDDTPAQERLAFNHRVGAFYEIHPDGTVVQKAVGDNYSIVVRNNYVHIEGEAYVTTDKGAKLFVNADRISEVEETEEGQKFSPHFDILVGDGANVNIKIEKGNLNTYIADGCNNVIIEKGDSTTIINGEGNINLDAHDGNINLHANGTIKLHSEKETQIHSVGDVLVSTEKNACIDIKGNADIKVGGDMTALIEGQTGIYSVGNMTLKSLGDVIIQGKEVHIN